MAQADFPSPPLPTQPHEGQPQGATDASHTVSAAGAGGSDPGSSPQAQDEQAAIPPKYEDGAKNTCSQLEKLPEMDGGPACVLGEDQPAAKDFHQVLAIVMRKFKTWHTPGEAALVVQLLYEGCYVEQLDTEGQLTGEFKLHQALRDPKTAPDIVFVNTMAAIRHAFCHSQPATWEPGLDEYIRGSIVWGAHTLVSMLCPDPGSPDRAKYDQLVLGARGYGAVVEACEEVTGQKEMPEGYILPGWMAGFQSYCLHFQHCTMHNVLDAAPTNQFAVLHQAALLHKGTGGGISDELRGKVMEVLETLLVTRFSYRKAVTTQAAQLGNPAAVIIARAEKQRQRRESLGAE